MDGILCVDKPLDWTSHDVVAVCRRVSGRARTGHGGTLDPQASGVLPILFGPATRFVERLHTAPKAYAATIVFGHETTTDDREGTPTRAAGAPGGGVAEIDPALDAFRGEIDQVPPDYAAVKVGGRRAYDRARAGERLVLTARRVRIDRFSIAEWQPPVLRGLVICSSGTYIRSLARDLGRALGSAAHLGGLVRIAVGALDLANATTMDTVRGLDAEGLAALLRPADTSLLTLDPRLLTDPARTIVDRALVGVGQGG